MKALYGPLPAAVPPAAYPALSHPHRQKVLPLKVSSARPIVFNSYHTLKAYMKGPKDDSVIRFLAVVLKSSKALKVNNSASFKVSC